MDTDEASELHRARETDYLSAAKAAALLGDDGGSLLLHGHADRKLILLGRRATGSGIHEPILPDIFAGTVRLNLKDNTVEVDAATEDFRAFELNANLRWEEVKVLTSAVEQFKKSLLGATRTRIDAESKCRKWLEEMMRKELYAPKSKAICRQEALENFPGLGIRGFDRAWKDAAKETDASAWLKSGRRPKEKASD